MRRKLRGEMSRRHHQDTESRTALAQQVLVLDGQPSSLHERQPQPFGAFSAYSIFNSLSG